ncbi:MAG: four helix bundle protein [Planctomycetes bacterium]|nr:four helix bundle protein [Planctomycetota bacterium]
MKSYRELIAWQLGMDLVVEVYRIVQQFPSHELYGLTSQTRRAAVSIPANIAEGHARDSTAEFLHHLSYAIGSAAELETHLLIAERLGYVSAEGVQSMLKRLDEFGRVVRGLQKSMNTRRDTKS